MSAAPPVVELRGVTRVFEEGAARRAVLSDASASIRAGEIAVILGRSGSGKSTLLNLVSGIDLPSAGEVIVDGVRLDALSERERTLFRRRRIGFIFQFFNLIPTLTVEENLLLPLELNEAVELADRARSFPDRLSGGEQQRVAVARALAHEPALMLADEPTGNLDLETGRKVLDLLDRLTRREGRTMLMVTHSPEVVGLADRVFAIESGKLVERAP
jgi:putative ABC transport system ATP-binding protein